MNCIIMTYNVETMKKLFKKNKLVQHYLERANAVSDTIKSIHPHILGIVEATNKLADHEYFLKETSLSGLDYKIALSKYNRGKQDLMFYYRDPFEVVSIDEDVSYYDDWIEDIDNDSINEVLRFERKPLEVVFQVKGTKKQVLIILVSFKSKGVFSVADINQYQYLAVANRKKLYGQSKKVRNRVDELLDKNPDMSIIIMGDINDEPGMDHFQKQVGASAVETLVGNIYEPSKIFHNTLWYQTKTKNKKDLWTIEYQDPIVFNLKMHRGWIDHIFISPSMLKSDAKIKYIMDSGEIAEKNETSQKASDHYPIYCKVRI